MTWHGYAPISAEKQCLLAMKDNIFGMIIERWRALHESWESVRFV
jgi:hypothetical protein